VELFVDVADQYRDFARYAGSSPCFEEWAEEVAEDEEVLAWIAQLPGIKQQPNLVFAAARWHGVPAPGDYPRLREAILSGVLRETIMTRATQTNEAGRLATLTPFLGRLAPEPIALLEVGASAGLCLYPDRYSYEWSTPHGVVRAGDGPPLRCRVAGRFPAEVALPRVAWRGGLDLNPLSVQDADQMAWLRTLVWPEEDERRAQLDRAIEVARTDPPHLVAGDLMTDLDALIDEASAYGPVVVIHSAVIAYLEPPVRADFYDQMLDRVDDGRCRWLSNEGPRVLPRITESGPGAPDDGHPFVLGLDGQAVAWTHGHGSAMTVL
jgi:hypothetical protein